MTSLSITDESFEDQIDWSEIGFHIKYASVIIVFSTSNMCQSSSFIQLHVYNCYLLLFDSLLLY
jgi:hypothetical protein